MPWCARGPARPRWPWPWPRHRGQGARTARRAFGRVHGPGHGAGHRPAGGGAHHQRHRGRRAPPAVAEADQGRHAADGLHGGPARPSCTTSARTRPSSRTGCSGRRSGGSSSPAWPTRRPAHVAIGRLAGGGRDSIGSGRAGAGAPQPRLPRALCSRPRPPLRRYGRAGRGAPRGTGSRRSGHRRRPARSTSWPPPGPGASLSPGPGAVTPRRSAA